jgi:Flp pilus assembly protein TadG
MGLIRRLGNQRGTSTLEFVVVLPTLLLVFLASLELSRAWLTVNIMTNAAREGARWGAVASPNYDSAVGVPSLTAVGRMTEILTAANLITVSKSVTCPAACPRDSQVTASVTVNFEPVAGGILWMLDNPLPLTEVVIMRRE